MGLSIPAGWWWSLPHSGTRMNGGGSPTQEGIAFRYWLKYASSPASLPGIFAISEEGEIDVEIDLQIHAHVHICFKITPQAPHFRWLCSTQKHTVSEGAGSNGWGWDSVGGWTCVLVARWESFPWRLDLAWKHSCAGRPGWDGWMVWLFVFGNLQAQIQISQRGDFRKERPGLWVKWPGFLF